MHRVILFSLFIPRTTDYEKRKATVLGLRLVTSVILLLVMAKSLQVFWDV